MNFLKIGKKGQLGIIEMKFFFIGFLVGFILALIVVALMNADVIPISIPLIGG